MDSPELLHGALTHRIIGAFFYVYNRLGHGFVESVYRKALATTLARTGTCLRQEAPLEVRFEGIVVGDFRVDLLVEDRVIVEVKAVDHLVLAHELQLRNYLRAAELQVGLLLNFGPRAVHRRILHSPANHRWTPRVSEAAPTRERNP